MRFLNWLNAMVAGSSCGMVRRSRRHLRSRAQRIRADKSGVVQALEDRCLLSAAQDIVQFTALKADPTFSSIDGRLENGQRIGVAVIDSGVLASHNDLRSKFLVYVDGFQQTATEQISAARDPGGHGTHVAGTILGGFSSVLNESVGVAPEAGLVAMNGLSPTASTTTDPILWNLNWVLQNHQEYNIKVVNMSLGTAISPGGTYVQNFNSLPAANDYFRVIRQLEAVGITVVTASGNSFVHFNAAGQSHPAVFSTLSVANTLAIQSDPYAPSDGLPTPQRFGLDLTPTADEFNVGSQRSTMANQIAAPGTDIISTWNDGSYNKLSGTSMASPLVSGVVALMQDAAVTFGGRYLTVSEVYSIITSTADTIVDRPDPTTRRGTEQQLLAFVNGQAPLGSLEDLVETGQSYRRINALRALQAVRTLVQTSSDGGQNTNADTNNTRTSAVEFPTLNGLHAYLATSRIGTDGGNTVGSRDVDLYKVVLETRGQIDLLTAVPEGGTGFDLYLRLFDAQGNEIASDDNSGPDNYALLRSPILPAATYYVGVSNTNNRSYSAVNGNGAVNSGAQGDYQLIVGTVNPDPNGVVQGAEPIDLISPNFVFPEGHPAREAGIYVANKVGSLIGSDPHPLHETDPERYPERIPVGATDVDMFRVVAPDTGTLFVDIQAKSVYGVNGVDSFVRVFRQEQNGSMTVVGQNDDRPDGNPDSFVSVPVEIGRTYFVALTTYGNQSFDPTTPHGRSSTTNETGLMDAYISFSNGDVNGTAFAETNLNEVAEGGIGSFPGVIGSDFGTPLSGANNGFKDVDFLAITPNQTGAFEVRVTSPDGTLNSALGIWRLNEANTDIEQVMVSSGQSPVARFSVTSGETFWISITGRGNEGFNWAAPASGTGGDTGNYVLTTAFLTQQNFRPFLDNSININQPTTIDFGQTIRATIGRDGDTAVGAADVDVYRFTPTVSQRVRVRATGGGVERSADTFLRVFNSAGTEISFNDDEHSLTRDSAVTFDAVAGQTYFIGVNGTSANARSYNPLTGAGAVPGSQGAYSVTVAAATSEVLTFTGTTGNDRFFLRYSGTGASAVVTVLVSSNGGATANRGTYPGNSRIALNGLAGSDSVQINGGTGNDVFEIASASTLKVGSSVISLNSIESRTLAGGAGNDTYKFTAGVPAGQFILNESGGGSDTIDMSAVTSSVAVNLGIASWQNVTSGLRLSLTSAATFENVLGGRGNDTLTGNNLANTVSGNGGNDILNGGGRSDTLIGGTGNDTYNFTTAASSEADVLVEGAGGGTDTLSFAGITTPVRLNLGSGAVQAVHTNRTIRLNSTIQFENAAGGSSNDTLTGNSAANLLNGNAGNDVLTGGAGSDTLIGGTGNDTYTFTTATSSEADVLVEGSGGGTDTLNFSGLATPVRLNLGSASVQAVHTNRTIRLNSTVQFENAAGGSGHDTLTGNSVANLLNGNAGNDILNGAAGSDTLIGGTGNDTYTFTTATSSEADVLVEGASGGTDTLNFSGLTTPVTLNLGSAAVQSVHTRRTIRLNSTIQFENVIGGSGNDILTGNSAANVLVGNTGNDRLSGVAGRDILIGGLGLDTLSGGNDDDILIAGRTTSDSLFNNLIVFRSAWLSGSAYATRVSTLRAGIGSPSRSLKAKTTVLNDAGENDQLTGGTGTDWYLRAVDDVIADLFTGELVDVL